MPASRSRPGKFQLDADGAALILDSIADGVFTVDSRFRITFFNRAAAHITGVSPEEALGSPCREVFRANICEGQCALRQTLEAGQPITNRPVYILRSDGTQIPISISTALLRGADGHVIGGVETFRDLSLLEELRKQAERRYTVGDLVSRNHRMQEIFAILPEIAESGSTVLIEGESGTGKEVLARAIHSLSPRASKPWVAVNCAALPDALLESELFGYVAGAFTDARKDKPGRFAQAEGGTLFLDEIGDISPALQVRLLRVLQEKTYEPLGSTRTVKADVRIIAATNRDLQAEVAAGRFRLDLYYRINIVRITLPPLRQRKEDIPLLTEYFIRRMNTLRGRAIQGLSPAALAAFLRYDWPGNVRELENAIEHAFILCRDGLIQPEHLPEAIIAGAKPLLAGAAHLTATAGQTGPDGGAGGGEPQDTAAALGRSRGSPGGNVTRLADLEEAAIRAALLRHPGHLAAAAKELGIHKTTLWRKMKKLGLSSAHQAGSLPRR